jgi:tetratricopeptide (TPR) repeat protein
MNQKIEWYKEVLALEPGSKVFFPLAKLQAENALPDEALSTLRHGISRNPEHIEARLLLIDILFMSGQFDALWPELDQVALMLGGYPGFWSAWKTRLAGNPSSKDASFALSFFSASLRGEAISWSAVIEQGLSSILLQGKGGAGNVPPKILPAELGELKTFLKDSAKPKPPEVVRTAVGEIPGKQSSQTGAAEAQQLGPKTPDFTELLNPSAGIEDGESQAVDTDDENELEDAVISLKTRSYAKVLEDQGDYSGAQNIYEELLRECKSAAEKKFLEEAIANISTKVRDNAAQASALRKDNDNMDDDDHEPAGQGKNRLLNVLDNLARRLEARS